MTPAEVKRASDLLMHRAHKVDLMHAAALAAGLTLQITGRYQEPGLVDAVRPHVLGFIHGEIARIDAELAELGVTPEPAPDVEALLL